MTHRGGTAAPSPGRAEDATGCDENLGLSVDCLTREEEARGLK